MRWALVGPLHPYRGGIAHYGALLARSLAADGADAVAAYNYRRLYPRLLFPGRTQYDESARPLTASSPRPCSSSGRGIVRRAPNTNTRSTSSPWPAS